MDDLNVSDTEGKRMANQLVVDGWWAERIWESVSGIQYGSVHIVIHDGKIVQIERTEKRRFDGAALGKGTVASVSADKAHGKRR